MQDRDFLSQENDIKNIPGDVILVSVDIVVFYLNIPQKDELSHSLGYLDKHHDEKKINEKSNWC